MRESCVFTFTYGEPGASNLKLEIFQAPFSEKDNGGSICIRTESDGFYLFATELPVLIGRLQEIYNSYLLHSEGRDR